MKKSWMRQKGTIFLFYIIVLFLYDSPIHSIKFHFISPFSFSFSFPFSFSCVCDFPCFHSQNMAKTHFSSFFFLVFVVGLSHACTNYLVTPLASETGAAMISYAAGFFFFFLFFFFFSFLFFFFFFFFLFFFFFFFFFFFLSFSFFFFLFLSFSFFFFLFLSFLSFLSLLSSLFSLFFLFSTPLTPPTRQRQFIWNPRPLPRRISPSWRDDSYL